MSTLRTKREQLRAAIATDLETATGVKTFATIPEKLVPPAYFIGPADRYLTREGANYGCEIVALNFIVVAAKGTNDIRAGELDDLIEAALDALYALEGQPGFEELTVGDVGVIEPIQLNGQGPYFSAPIDIAIEINRQEQP